METGKINRKRSSFTMVANKAMRDEHLSLKAKGLYSLMQSYLDMESIGFVVYKSYLQTHCCSDGRESFNSAWKELEKAGYLISEKKRSEKGTYVYEYTVLDSPNVENKDINNDPHTGNPSLDNPHLDNPVVEGPVLDKPSLDAPDPVNPSVNKEVSKSDLKNNTKHMYFSGITPEEFLIAKQNGAPLSSQEKSILRTLAKYNFPPEIQIALLDHVLSVSQNRLVRSFVEMVAGEWARDNVRNMDDVEREKNKTLTKGQRKEVLPAYYYEDSQSPDYYGKTISPEEARRVEQMLRSMGANDTSDDDSAKDPEFPL